MQALILNAKAAYNLLKNKAVALLVLFVLGRAYAHLPSEAPFAEILYAVVLISSVAIFAPILRLLVFPEVSHYAEGKDFKADLAAQQFTPAMIHYWIATLICFGVSLLCVSSLLSH